MTSYRYITLFANNGEEFKSYRGVRRLMVGNNREVIFEPFSSTTPVAGWQMVDEHNEVLYREYWNKNNHETNCAKCGNLIIPTVNSYIKVKAVIN